MVVEIIRAAVRSGQRVLACAPSNAAVDNLVERLAELDDPDEEINFVRLGAPERISAAATASSLDSRVEETASAFFERERARRREIVELTKRGWAAQEKLQGDSKRRRPIKKGGGGASNDAEEAKRVAAKLDALRAEQRSLAKSGRKVRARAERDVLQNAHVVLATSIGAGASNVQKLPAFDLCVLDEAAQATEVRSGYTSPHTTASAW